IFAGQRRSATDDGKFQLLPLQVLDHVFHFQGGLDQQAAETDCVGFVVLGGFYDVVARLLDTEVDDAKTVVGKNDVNEVFADIVDIPLDGGQNDCALLGTGFLLHFGLKIGHRLFHNPS